MSWQMDTVRALDREHAQAVAAENAPCLTFDEGQLVAAAKQHQEIQRVSFKEAMAHTLELHGYTVLRTNVLFTTFVTTHELLSKAGDYDCPLFDILTHIAFQRWVADDPDVAYEQGDRWEAGVDAREHGFFVWFEGMPTEPELAIHITHEQLAEVRQALARLDEINAAGEQPRVTAAMLRDLDEQRIDVWQGVADILESALKSTGLLTQDREGER